MQVSETTDIQGKTMEYSREEKIGRLKSFIDSSECSIELFQNHVEDNTFDEDDIQSLQDAELEKQAYELLLHKLEKGEAK